MVPLRVVELAGESLVVGAALVEIVVRSGAYAFVAIGGALAIAVWGAVTRVRRRVAFATLATVLAVVLVLAVPLVDLVTGSAALRDTAIWIAARAF